MNIRFITPIMDKFKFILSCKISSTFKMKFKKNICSSTIKLDNKNTKPLAKKYTNHALTDYLSDLQDCHIKRDLVLLYLKLGSHNELGI